MIPSVVGRGSPFSAGTGATSGLIYGFNTLPLFSFDAVPPLAEFRDWFNADFLLEFKLAFKSLAPGFLAVPGLFKLCLDAALVGLLLCLKIINKLSGLLTFFPI